LQPVAASAQADHPAESLRAYFAARDRLIDKSDTTVSVFIRRYFAVQTPPECKIRSVEDNPAHVDPGTVAVYLVDMTDADALCEAAPSGACRAIRRSCVAVETSIFCDAAFEAGMTLLSEAAYADLFLWVYVNERGHHETAPERAERQLLPMLAQALAFPPMLRTDTFSGVARSIAYMETHAGQGDTFKRKIEDVARCHGSAMAQMPLQLGVYGPVIAHEYGHIEQNACPSGAVPVPADAKKEIARYPR
jgi:hypothetical protein